MESMRAIDPALRLTIRDDWRLVASAAGRYSDDLKASLSVWDGDTMYDPESFFLSKGDARRAYALLICNRVRGFSQQLAEALILTMYQQVEGILRQAPRRPPLQPDGTEPTAPPPDYKATPNGILWMKDTKEGPVPVLLCNFVAQIVSDVSHDDGAEVLHMYEIAARRHGSERRVQVEASQFASLAWVATALGAEAIVMPGQALKDHTRAAVQLLSGPVETRTIYAHTGWRCLEGQWCYVHGGGAIGPEGATAAVEVAQTEPLARYQLTLPEDDAARHVACVASLTVLETGPEVVTFPLYAALWRACLGSSDFSAHLTGPTGTGKTELAALIQQHWGLAMDARHLPGSWSSTGNALEVLGFTLKDAVLVVDDFCPGGTPQDIARSHREADRLLRGQGNHSGRGRLRPDGTLRPVKPPRGVILSTGEDIPKGQSLAARQLILEVEAGTLHWPVISACQTQARAGLYATALGGFVQWLAPHYAEVQRQASPEVEALRRLITPGGHQRTVTTIAQLLWAWQHVLAYLWDTEVLSQEECEQYFGKAWVACQRVLATQDAYQRSEDPVRRFIQVLRSIFVAGKGHLADPLTLAHPSVDAAAYGWQEETRRDGGITWHARGECLGWLGDGEMLLDADVAFKAVQQFTTAQQAPFPVTQRTLWKRLQEAGVLLTQPSQPQHTVVRTIGRKNTRVLALSLAAYLSKNSSSSAPPETASNPQQENELHGYCFPTWWQSRQVVWAT